MTKDLLHIKIYEDLFSRANNESGAENDRYLLKSDIVNGFPNNFMTEELKNAIDNDEVEYAFTSGTTSNRMQVIRPKNWWKDEYARTYNNNKLLRRCVDESLPKAVLTTAVCSNTVCFACLPSFEERIINGTLYLNSEFNPWNWTQEDIKSILFELKKFNTYYLDVDPIYFYIFLLKLEEYGLEDEMYMPKVMTVCYEYAPKSILKYIKSKVSCPVYNLYGTTEYGCVFLSDDSGDLVLCDDMLDVKFLPIEGSNNLYELVISSWKNKYMPLFNYIPGDIFELTSYQYKNFKSDKRVKSFAGRKKDLIIRDKLVSLCDIDVIMGEIENMGLYQVEIDNNMFFIKYTTHTTDDINEQDKKLLISKLGELFGAGTKISLDKVCSIPPESSGKFALIKSI